MAIMRIVLSCKRPDLEFGANLPRYVSREMEIELAKMMDEEEARRLEFSPFAAGVPDTPGLISFLSWPELICGFILTLPRADSAGEKQNEGSNARATIEQTKPNDTTSKTASGSDMVKNIHAWRKEHKQPTLCWSVPPKVAEAAQCIRREGYEKLAMTAKLEVLHFLCTMAMNCEHVHAAMDRHQVVYRKK